LVIPMGVFVDVEHEDEDDDGNAGDAMEAR
jgi:hypothetical protein